MKKYVLAALMLSVLVGCSTAYYGTMEKFGVYKRDILIDRVKDARNSQEKAKKQFNSALEQFGSVVAYKGGDLEATYNKLDKEYKRSVDAADDVRQRIRSIEKVSKDLFKEWEKELGQYSSAKLRADSERQLRETRREYQTLIRAMKKAESKIPPVLEVFEDQVLYLKHNLNARAISSLKSEYTTIRSDVGRLVREMEKSINEANQFIANMNHAK